MQWHFTEKIYRHFTFHISWTVFKKNINSKEIDGETMELLLSYIYTGLVCKCSWPEKEFLQLDIKIFLVLNDTHFLLCGIKNVSQVTDFKNVSELQLVELFKAADRWLALHLDWICKSAKDLWIFWNCFAWNWATDWHWFGRYRLDHLKNMCEEELVKRVEASNAADILRSF